MSSFAQPGFDPVEVLDLFEEPTGGTRGGFFGLEELPPHMRPTSGQAGSACFPWRFARSALGQGRALRRRTKFSSAYAVGW